MCLRVHGPDLPVGIPLHRGLRSAASKDTGSPDFSRLCSVLLVSSDYILTGNTETSDVLGVTARLSRLPAEHIKNVENILDRYMEGIAISRQIQMHGEKNG